MIILKNDYISRVLHNALYERIYNFCTTYTPEFPAELATNNWLNRLYNSDNKLQLFVTLDEHSRITEHAIVDIQSILDHVVIYVHQVQFDKPSIANAVGFMEYLDKLQEEIGAACIVINVAKGAKLFEKRHGYKISRSVIIKTAEETEVEDG